MTIGYDKFILNHQICLDLTMEEMVGVTAHCRSPYIHNCTLHGVPAWAALANGTPYLDFDSTNPDWLDAPGAATTQLDFIAGDFSLAAWIYLDSLAANRMVMCRGLLDTDGWHWAIDMNGAVQFYTNQVAPAHQVSFTADGAIATANWYLVGITRIEGAVSCWINAVDLTNTHGVHLDPTTSARELHIGIYDNEVGSPWEGRMHRPRIWDRLLAKWEWERLYNLERDLFGV